MPKDPGKQKLTRDRVLAAAVSLADEIGLESLTIRKLAAALEVGPMTIYHHVPSKEAIIDGIVDIVFTEIASPPPDLDWKAAMRVRCESAREVLTRHPWAPPVMESRVSPGEATLAHHDDVLGCFQRADFSPQLTAHAYAILDSFIYGFALEEANLPDGGGEEMIEMGRQLAAEWAKDLPHLAQFTVEHVLQPGYRFGDSFDFGLGLILDGLEQAHATEST